MKLIHLTMSLCSAFRGDSCSRVLCAMADVPGVPSQQTPAHHFSPCVTQTKGRWQSRAGGKGQPLESPHMPGTWAISEPHVLRVRWWWVDIELWFLSAKCAQLARGSAARFHLVWRQQGQLMSGRQRLPSCLHGKEPATSPYSHKCCPCNLPADHRGFASFAVMNVGRKKKIFRNSINVGHKLQEVSWLAKKRAAKAVPYTLPAHLPDHQKGFP